MSRFRPAPAHLEEIGDRVFAYIQPDGTWGWSNAGLIGANGESLLVDTLFDLGLTQAMLDTMQPITSSKPINAVVNTHGNGDHCYGNQLVPATARIFASNRTVDDLKAAPPTVMVTLLDADLGPELTPYVRRIFGPFRFDDIEMRLPSDTFDGELELTVGGRRVNFIEVGPAHTAGDTVVHVPDAGVVFTGDVLFIGGTPIMWEGPTANWLAACDRLLALGADTFVPGHGPVTDAEGVRAVARYLRYVRDEAAALHAAGMTAEQAAAHIDLGEFADWTDAERITVNVETIYRELEPDRPAADIPELFARMARWSKRAEG